MFILVSFPLWFLIYFTQCVLCLIFPSEDYLAFVPHFLIFLVPHFFQAITSCLHGIYFVLYPLPEAHYSWSLRCSQNLKSHLFQSLSRYPDDHILYPTSSLQSLSSKWHPDPQPHNQTDHWWWQTSMEPLCSSPWKLYYTVAKTWQIISIPLLLGNSNYG